MPATMRGKRFTQSDLAVVIGAGRSGLSAAKLLRRYGVKVRLLESNGSVVTNELRTSLDALGVDVKVKPFAAEDFVDARVVIPSPGIAKAKILPCINVEKTELVAEMELAYRYLDSEPILAVTGTSGKTTTVSVAAAMLKQQGYSVFLGGNIGTPLSEYVLDDRKVDVIVVEISSFQLQACTTFAPKVGVMLNLSPNHLDYHKDMQEYADAKFRLFRWQDANDLAVLGANLRDISAKYSLQAQTVFVQACDRFQEMQLLGHHNQFNCEAAWQACRFFGVSLDNAKRAVAMFRPLPNRLERVREHHGVLYVNDSKCTTVTALEVALRSFERPIRLLCGGKFKGGDLKALQPLVKAKVREIALFGDARAEFEAAFQNVVPLSWHATLQPAVETLYEHATRGEVVLLAPATASFDLYKNYVERGSHFRSIVESLA